MGTGMLATIGDTPKIANLSDPKESEQAHVGQARPTRVHGHLNCVSPSAHERVGGGRIARLPGTENLHCRRYAAGP